MKRRSAYAALLAAIALSCGGGGSGDGGGVGVGGGGGGSNDPWSSVVVTVAPAHPHVCKLRGYPRYVEAVITLDRVPPHAEMWENTMLDGEVRRNGYLSDQHTGENRYRFSAPTLQSDPVGIHEGVATFEICPDMRCETRYTLAQFPYTLEVLAPMPPLVVSVDGQTLTGGGSSSDSYRIPPGRTVTVTSALPVTWDTGSKSGLPDVEEGPQTPTSWSLTVRGGEGDMVEVKGWGCQRVTSVSAYLYLGTP